MHLPKPEKEHAWLQKLVGEWTYEFEAPMKPGEPPVQVTGTESVRSVGDVWIVAESQGTMPGGTESTALLTLGYDPQKKKFVGTWIGSMMANLWVYEGELDAAGTTLSLNTEGPHFSVEGKTAKYREVIEVADDGRRNFTSFTLTDDGQWQQIMAIRFRRAE